MMDDRTLRALKASITHWEENLECTLDTARVGADSCALCALFMSFRCDGCPVKQHTGWHGCIKTPFDAVVIACSYDDEQAFRKACAEEVAFLKSLLPENTAVPDEGTEFIGTPEQLATVKCRWEQHHNDMTLQEFIDSVQPTIGCGGAVTVKWAGMWLCIEKSGYCHT